MADQGKWGDITQNSIAMWPLYGAGHAHLKINSTECSTRLFFATRLILYMYILCEKGFNLLKKSLRHICEVPVIDRNNQSTVSADGDDCLNS